MTEDQLDSLTKLLKFFAPSVCGHNDGPGSDQEFSSLSAALGLNVWANDSSLSPMPKNRELVMWCDILIGSPPTPLLLKKGFGYVGDDKVRMEIPKGSVRDCS